MLPHQFRYVARKLVHSPMFTGITLLTLPALRATRVNPVEALRWK